MGHATPLAAVLLDLDGTLLDTAPDMVRIANQMRAAEQLPPLPFADLRLQVSHGSAAVLRAAFPGIEPLKLASLQSRFLEQYREHIALETRLFPGFEAVLAALEAQSHSVGRHHQQAGLAHRAADARARSLRACRLRALGRQPAGQQARSAAADHRGAAHRGRS